MTSARPRPGSSRGRVLDLIRTAGPISRVELAERIGLTQATVSTAVRDLLADGLVAETGRAESTGGKPRTSLEINPSSRLGVGVHVDHDRITYLVADLGGTVVGRLSVDTGDRGPAETVAAMGADVERLLEGLDVDREAVVGLGLAVPGPIDRAAGAVMGPPSLAGWAGFPLADALSTLTGLPVVFDNDATAAAIGEFWLGGTAAASAYASVYMGRGIGAGIVIDGTLYRGENANVGELGHVSVDVRGRACPCGGIGCVERYAAPSALAQAGRDAVERGALDIRLTGSDPVDFATIAGLAVGGDETARAIVEEAAEYLAFAVVSMVNLIDLRLIVLTGEAFSAAGPIYLDTVSRVLRERAMTRDIRRIDVRMSTGGDDAVAIGAATMPLRDTLSPRSLASIALT